MLARWLLSVLALVTSVHATNLDDYNQNVLGLHWDSDYIDVCDRIEKSVSDKTGVFYPDSPTYEKDISHFTKSSAQEAQCSVEPGTPADVGIILDILGSTRTPFSVKGGGHTTNPGFSSSPGVQIAMYRFSDINYSAETQSVDVGAGLVWDDVYAALAPYDVTVIGARITGVGVAGFTLGGGFSWKTNQHGLTLDTVLSFELVKPNGQVVIVTETTEPDLFFALRGGLNNFGIVTRFTLKTFPQGPVWGGAMAFDAAQVAAVNSVTAEFTASVTDPKASIATFYSFMFGQLIPAIFMFYDGPTPPAGIFDDILAIPSIANDAKTRDYLSLIQAAATVDQIGPRAISNTVSLLDHSPKLLDVIVNETTFWGTHLANGTTPFVMFSVEPFFRSIFSHNTSPRAYPSDSSVGYNPLNVLFSWNDESFDADAYEASRQSTKRIYDMAIEEGQAIEDAPLYPNYVIFDTPLVKMYGVQNVERLKKVKAAVDPHDVMDLAGGFKI